LVAGPFASAADAQRACADLKARGATCQTAEFNGEAL
jgi:SPOR domain